jgi:hypothetical protein
MSQFFPYNSAEYRLNFFLAHRLFKRLVDQRLIPSLTGLELKEGYHTRIYHDIDPLLAGDILKVYSEP